MRRSASAFVLVLLLVSPACAQTTGSINGTVTDNSGALFPGVTVTATSPALMGAQTAVTNEQGQYRFPSLPTGKYALKYQLPGLRHRQPRGDHRHHRVHGDDSVQLALASVSRNAHGDRRVARRGRQEHQHPDQHHAADAQGHPELA